MKKGNEMKLRLKLELSLLVNKKNFEKREGGLRVEMQYGRRYVGVPWHQWGNRQGFLVVVASFHI